MAFSVMGSHKGTTKARSEEFPITGRACLGLRVHNHAHYLGRKLQYADPFTMYLGGRSKTGGIAISAPSPTLSPSVIPAISATPSGRHPCEPSRGPWDHYHDPKKTAPKRATSVVGRVCGPVELPAPDF